MDTQRDTDVQERVQQTGSVSPQLIMAGTSGTPQNLNTIRI